MRGPLPPTAGGRLRRVLPLLGPAFVAAVAYVDPGNFATNITAGAQYGTLLVWVVVVSNLLAVLVQYLSAKLGVATGWGLARNCRDHFPRPVTRGLWVQAELVAMATDLAEVLGGALALNLLFGLPLLYGGMVTGVVAFGMLALTGRGHRPYEQVVVAMLGVILLGFLVDVLRAGPDAADVAGGLVPALQGTDTPAAGLRHPRRHRHAARHLPARLAHRAAGPAARRRRAALAARGPEGRHPRRDAHRRRRQPLDAGARRHAVRRAAEVDTIEEAYAGLDDQLGRGAALGFALALLASGFAASSVGTYSGQVVMKGFLRREIPLLVRRGITLAPALVVLALGVDPTHALVLSQVVLSFGIPFALVPAGPADPAPRRHGRVRQPCRSPPSPRAWWPS